MANKLKVLDIIALVLVIIGGLNWGLVAFSPSYDLVQLLFGMWPIVAQLVYLLVGIAAVYLAVVMRSFGRK
jgi:uncharacterized membrane protein YuzA (DUF378 family)